MLNDSPKVSKKLPVVVKRKTGPILGLFPLNSWPQEGKMHPSLELNLAATIIIFEVVEWPTSLAQ
jgi:hypothetical protein